MIMFMEQIGKNTNGASNFTLRHVYGSWKGV